jgi:hypothetical protein
MINGEFEALGELQTIRRAGFRAKIAKHAARCVEDKRGQDFFLVYLFAFSHFPPNRPNLDAINRAGERAKIACDA